jgi:hypothetical protein
MKKTKNQFFSHGRHIFPNFFFLKYFLVDKLTSKKKIFWASCRKKGMKTTFDFDNMTFLKISICFFIPRA